MCSPNRRFDVWWFVVTLIRYRNESVETYDFTGYRTNLGKDHSEPMSYVTADLNRIAFASASLVAVAGGSP